MNNDDFTWLEAWYLNQCNGEWEHTYGIHIGTLDNPGWMVKIDLKATRYAELSHAEVTEKYESDSEWMLCRIVEGVYEGAGGPLMLGPIIQTFRSWMEAF